MPAFQKWTRVCVKRAPTFYPLETLPVSCVQFPPPLTHGNFVPRLLAPAALLPGAINSKRRLTLIFHQLKLAVGVIFYGEAFKNCQIFQTA